mgnify:CR=1 FL=1
MKISPFYVIFSRCGACGAASVPAIKAKKLCSIWLYSSPACFLSRVSCERVGTVRLRTGMNLLPNGFELRIRVAHPIAPHPLSPMPAHAGPSFAPATVIRVAALILATFFLF